ncbi:MAG TPA: hypothetical protein VIV12_28890, partial [Streptosporangiaceae bacterium]
MVKRIRPPGTAGRTGLAALAVGALIALAACGSEAAGGHSASADSSVPGGKASAGVALCRDIPRLTSVVVSRAMPLRETQPGEVVPSSLAIHQSLAVRGLAT